MRQDSSLKVSVCVVTYNHEHFIEAAIQSVLSQQTDFPIEVLIGDDCSTDATSAMVDAIADKDGRVRVLRPERNMGPSQNFLATHNAARGEYATYFDGDDLMAPGKLAKQVALLDARPELSACGHRMRIIDETGRDLGRKFPAIPLGDSFDLGKLIRFSLPVKPSSMMYRRSARTLLFSEVDFYDWHVFADIMKSGPAGYIDECLGAYRIHEASQVARLGGSIMIQGMVDHYRQRLAELPQYRADFMAQALMWAWQGLMAERRIDPAVWNLISASATPKVVGPLIDVFRWARANKSAEQRG